MPSFHMAFLFFELVNMRSTYLKFNENVQLSGAYCNWNNLKQTKTIRLFWVFDFVYRAKTKTQKSWKVFFYFKFSVVVTEDAKTAKVN